MGGKYFKEIYDWLRNYDGYAMVSEFLWTYQIPAMYNPATDCQRAPVSTSIDEAVYATMGPVEQHILEAVAEERQGFRGGYISSKCFDDLLRDIKWDSKLGPHRRLYILESLGYHRHPWLHDGRVDNPIPAEGSKIRLYWKGPLVSTHWSAAAVSKDYQLKQGYLAGGVSLV